MKLRIIPAAVMAIGVASATQAEETMEIVITEGVTLPTQYQVTVDQIDESITADGGDLLRAIPGVSGSRMGGHGIDPVIRGQSQTRVNVLIDGAYVQGACPNRMDPPTGYSPVETFDSVTVIKGAQTVVYGSGGSGGTVLFERKTPRLGPDESLRGRAGAGYTSNSKTQDAYADVTAGSETYFVRAIGQYTDADNYQDGDGNKTRTAYHAESGSLTFGYTPDFDRRLELSLETSRDSDMLYAGAGMDAPKANADTVRLRYENAAKVGVFKNLKTEFYSSNVDHVMDNYSLRPLSGMMKMKTDSTSDTRGGRVSAELEQGARTWTLGVDAQYNARNATRYSGPAMGGDPTTAQSLIWPGVNTDQTGLFAEVKMPMSKSDTVKAGLRYDKIAASADKATTAAMGTTPNDLYTLYYGTVAKDRDENNVGGFLRFERALSGDGSLFASLSRAVRTADASERFIAAANSVAMMRWVGNPQLNPEVHSQLEVGGARSIGAWRTSASVYYNSVSDYILRDRAHGQSGVLLSDGATIYRNVDAELYGTEVSLAYAVNDRWNMDLSLSYVHATNTSDDRVIAQMPPLEGTLGTDYYGAGWSAGADLRFADKQGRVDDNSMTGSGLDAGQTAGWGTLDLFGAVDVARGTQLKFGIDNVMDKAYAYHVNRANSDPFNPAPVQVNEPGRSVWARVATRF